MMKSNSCKNNRQAMMALLLCTGFIAMYPLAISAKEDVSSLNVVQQQKSVSGVIKDSTGEPIIGANVREQNNPTNGTITDLEGKFNLTVTKTTKLEISFIGYKTTVIEAIPGKSIDVVLEDDSEMLDEVIVVGYGTQKRKYFAGSVSTVKTEDSPIALMPSSNAMDFLRGTTTGLTVSQQQGAGQAPSIVVRGQKSINGGSDPLIVMDGVIFTGAYRDIDPSTIESISVLKDATSLAAYGSQAANGVS